MMELQEWFQPLLWICGVVATLAGFYKLTVPFLKELSETPKQLRTAFETMNASQKDLQDRMEAMKLQLENVLVNVDKLEQIEIHLLHDAILGIYDDAKRDNTITESSYRRALELYGLNGKDEYIKHIMSELDEIHMKGE